MTNKIAHHCYVLLTFFMCLDCGILQYSSSQSADKWSGIYG